MGIQAGKPLFEPDALDDAARAYIQRRVKEGASRKAIVQELLQRGYNQALAEAMVDAASRGHASSARRSGLLLLIAGIIITVVFLGLTIGSYLAAVEQGGTYVVCCGLILFGLYLITRGITQLIKGREVK
jgi:hypothetical protein